MFRSDRHEFERASDSIDHPMLSTIEIAFPDTQHTPAGLPESAGHKPIPRNILIEFTQPKIQPAFRRVTEFAAGMPMPEATINEYG